MRRLGLGVAVLGWVSLFALESRAEWSTRNVGGSSVHLYVPASSGTAGSGRGLLVALHGCTQQNGALRDRGGFEAAAELYGMVVALPQVPNGGVLAGCWDYYGANHTRTSRHDGFLIELAETLRDDGALAIDGDQIYVAGLSSGAGQTAIIGCLAPDLFAGVGINAGPAPGTSSSEFAVVSSDVEEAKSVCTSLAGSQSAHFDTQLAAIIHGTRDYVVAQGYAGLLAALYAELYGADDESALDVAQLEGHEPAGTGTWFSDAQGPRVSLIMADGMGHAWPGGTGPGPEISFIASEGVAWPMFLAQFFTENNRRVGADTRPDGGAATSGEDAEVHLADGSAETPRDAGQAKDGAPAAESETEPKVEDGCGCTNGRTSAAGAAWLFFAVLILRRAGRR